jgi:YidC/Oxa1 family membrane protein insertase
MERNALLAVVISLLILVIWNEVVLKQYEPAVQPGQEETVAGEPLAPAARAPAAPAAPAAPPAAGAAAPVVDEEAPQVAGGEDVVVDTDVFRAVFTTAGGRLKSLRLNDYQETAEKGSPPQELVQVIPGSALPLGLYLRGGEDEANDAGVLYTVDRKKLVLAGQASGTLVFTGELDGTTIVKRVELTGDRYLWSVDLEVGSPPPWASELAVTWHGLLEKAGGWQSGVVPAANPYSSVLALEDDSLRTLTDEELTEGVEFEGPTDWIGLNGQYFFSGLISGAEQETPTTRAWAISQAHRARAMLRFVGQTTTASVIVYTGPKDIDRLEAAGHGLRRALDLGWFTIVALPLLQLLRFLYDFTGNHGVDIVILTVLIKVLFYPLTKKSFQSMKAMQKLQPEMERLKEAYKDKPEQMNQAVMEMYRKHKVNPLGGCLPMFLQLPVFIGLYNALLNAVELRHAPFVGWIQDLSAPDRLGDFQLPFVTGAGIPVLTLIMGASMLVQQKMTPSATADPMQQRMMMLMPIIFTFMFINFPAGLTLYWLVNNILTIGQQYLINRQED